MEEILVSIIIPIYNVEKYLLCCLNSVIRQTYKNIEIICVDDGSSDHSREIVLRLAAQDNRIRLIERENGGVSAARNTGLDSCKGQYIIFLDSDDYMNLEAVDILVGKAKETKSDIVICNFAEFTNEIKNNKAGGFFREFTEPGLASYKRAYNGMYLQMNVVWGKLYRAGLFEGKRYPEGKIHEDEFLTYQLIVQASQVTYLDTVLYYYRIREDSIVHREFSRDNLAIVEAFRERVDFFERQGEHYFVNESIKMYLGELILLYMKVKDRELNRELYLEYRVGFAKYKDRLDILRKLRGLLFLASPELSKRIERIIHVIRK